MVDLCSYLVDFEITDDYSTMPEKLVFSNDTLGLWCLAR
jgi:hypothetical protein